MFRRSRHVDRLVARTQAQMSVLAALTSNDLATINHAIRAHERLRRPDNTVLANLGLLLKARFEQRGDLADIDRAARLLGTAIRGTRPGFDATIWVAELGGVHRARFERTGDRADITKAIEFGAAALASDGAPDDGYHRAWLLHKQGGHLARRFVSFGDRSDLDAAVALTIEAVRVIFESDDSLLEQQLEAECLSNLCGILRTRSEFTGSVAEARAAVEAGEACLATFEPDGRAPTGFRSNLALALIHRHDLEPNGEDVSTAVDLLRDVHASTPRTHPDFPDFVSNLSVALRATHDYLVSLGAHEAALPLIREAVTAAREAVALTSPDDPRMARFRGNLGSALTLASRGEGLFSDHSTETEGITELRAAIRDARPGDPDRSRLWWELGGALARRALFGGGGHSPEEDRDEAIAALRQAAESYDTDHPARSDVLFQLGQELRNRAETTGAADLDAAIEAFTAGAEVARANPFFRINCVTGAGGSCAQAGRWEDAYRHYSRAVSLLPGAAPEDMRQEGREHWLGRLSGIASTAAAMALQLDRVDSALELLEAGRGIMVAQWMERSASGEASDDDGPGDAILEGGAPSAAYLRQLAAEGPVVILNLSRARCDAITLTASGPRVIPLTTFTWYDALLEAIYFAEALTQINADDTDADADGDGGWWDVLREAGYFTEALTQINGDGDADIDGTDADPEGDDGSGWAGLWGGRSPELRMTDVLGWLWDHIAEPVLTALDLTEPASTQTIAPRLWWIPTGVLATLPLHAAGHHQDGARPGRTVMDRVVSSYAPTLRSLAHSRREREPLGSAGHRMLVVSMSRTPGAADLLLADAEADAVTRRCGARGIDHTVLRDSDATRDAVLAALAGSSVAHLACHSVMDPLLATRTGILLHDHRTAPLTLADVIGLGLARSRLAFLSACDTARARGGLQDEAVHPGSAFLLAGFPQIVATLWPASDSVAAQIADRFHAELALTPAGPETPGAAHALHRATLTARERFRGYPSLWAAHVHLGR